MQDQDQMNIVIVGHVDHGKSTIIGRLLADTHSLPDGKLEAVRLNCERNSKPFEYAFLLDALKDEQSQGITIDAARVFFKTPNRHYIILDAPGHIEFLKNMITGAARAEAALLVIDAGEGVQENSRRHGYMLSMLGVKQVVVLINKMDLVNYSREVFENIQNEYSSFLEKTGIKAKAFIPVSGMEGDFIVSKNRAELGWYKGLSVVESLDSFHKESPDAKKPFRMYVQDIYKFTRFGDNRRIIAGSPVSGSLRTGEEVIFLPSGKKATVQAFESFNEEPPEELLPEMAGGFTLNEQLYITRGEVVVKTGEDHPIVGNKITTSVFWLGKEPMVEKKDYLMRLGTSRVIVRLEKINGIIDASNLSTQSKNIIERNDVADVVLSLKKPLVFDVASVSSLTSRFVIIDNYEITGGGIIREVTVDAHSEIKNSILLRKYKWEKSLISMAERGERYSQRPTLVILTGEKGVDKKGLARELEQRLFQEGRVVYYLGIGNIKYGVDADIADFEKGVEHVRRLAEVANIILDLGAILIITATGLMQEDLDIIKASVNADQIETVWMGDNIVSDIQYDLHIGSDDLSSTDCVTIIKNNLQDKGLIFSVWK
jgi:bifunctional enzyme CysN/CysC